MNAFRLKEGTGLLCNIIYLMQHHFPYKKPYATSCPYATSFTLCNIMPLCNIISIYGLYSRTFFNSNLQISTSHKIFSPPTHPHSNHFTYKYQNFSYFYFTYMVHKPHTFQVLAKLVYGL